MCFPNMIAPALDLNRVGKLKETCVSTWQLEKPTKTAAPKVLARPNTHSDGLCPRCGQWHTVDAMPLTSTHVSSKKR